MFSRLGVSIRRAAATIRIALTRGFFTVRRYLLLLPLRGRDFLAVSGRRLALGIFVFAAVVYFLVMATTRPIEEVALFFWVILGFSTAGFVYLYLSVTSSGKTGEAAHGLLTLATGFFAIAAGLLWPNRAALWEYAITLLPPRYQLFDRILEAIPPELKSEYAPFIAAALFFTCVCIALVRNYYR